MKNEQSAESEFKKCPCCGGDVCLIAAEGVTDMQLMARATVRCTDCQLGMTRTARSRNEAIYTLQMAWNRRAYTAKENRDDLSKHRPRM